ncbi:MAG TPA: hypothetical protein QF571_10955 [Desulfobacterales bacterium]|nr:hypothetical protein [Desulfobacterales bacterium]
MGFRKWREDDLVFAKKLWGDYEVTKFFDARDKLSQNEIQERLAKEIITEKEHGVQYWPIFLLETNEHIGCCGLRPHGSHSRFMRLVFTSVQTNGGVDTQARQRLRSFIMPSTRLK